MARTPPSRSISTDADCDAWYSWPYCRSEVSMALSIARRFAEIILRGGIDAERAAAHVGAVEIELEDLVFRQPGLQPDRQKCLLDLAFDGAFVAEEQVLGELLRDRGATLHDAAGSRVG